MTPSFLYIITPLANLPEEALGEFEAAMRRELGTIEFLQRNVKGQTNSFFRGSDADGKTQFLWLMQLDLVSPEVGTGGSAFPMTVDRVKEVLKNNATVAGFRLSDSSG